MEGAPPWWRPGAIRTYSGMEMAHIEYFARPLYKQLSWKGEMRLGCVQTLVSYRGESRWGRPTASLFHRLHQLPERR